MIWAAVVVGKVSMLGHFIDRIADTLSSGRRLPSYSGKGSRPLRWPAHPSWYPGEFVCAVILSLCIRVEGSLRTVSRRANSPVSPPASCSSILVPHSVSRSSQSFAIWQGYTHLIQPVIIIVLLATTPRSEMHSAAYVFGKEGVVNQTGGWNDGIAFLFGLLSVQWTVRTNLFETEYCGIQC